TCPHWAARRSRSTDPYVYCRRTPARGGPGASYDEIVGPSGHDASMDAIALLIAVLTLVAGFAAGWALARGRGSGLLAERDAARAETNVVRGERDRLASEVRTADTAAADAVARLETERHSASERITELRQAQVELKEAFASLSQDALRKNNQQFLELADTKFKEAGAPLTETLGKV